MNDNTKLFKINSGKTARKHINSPEVKQYSFIPINESSTLVREGLGVKEKAKQMG